MRLDRASTLAHHLDIPHRKAIAFGDAILASDMRLAVKHTHQSLSGAKMALPDWEAIEFYALNQLSAILQAKFHMYQDLPPWANAAAEAYTRCLCGQNLRLMHYTLLIITRESRHLYSKPSFFSAADKGANMSSAFKQFLNTISGGSDGAVAHFLDSAPDILLSEYTANITDVFNKGSYSGGYGGKPWGNIAATLHSYVSGKTSAEIFLDTAYTLAHNNGPIFNKGMYYHSYSDALKKILDVQRSGQVCEVFLDGNFASAYNSDAMKGKVAKLRHIVIEAKQALQAMGDTTSIGPYCDWHKVEALGSLQKYPKEKALQNEKYGKKPAGAPAVAPTPVPPVPVAKPVPPPPTFWNGKPSKITGALFVLPNSAAKVHERISK